MDLSACLPSTQNDSSEITAAAASNTLQDLNIKQIIARSSPRSWINLSHQQLVDQNMEIVAQQAIVDKQCTTLDLGFNSITSIGVSIISNALGNSTTIQRLYFGNNQVADDGVKQLAFSVGNSTLFVLGLSKNGITDLGAQYLGEILKINRHLTVLGLENNTISDRGVELLADALKYNNTLQRLLLAENKMISGSSVDALIDMLQHNHSLKRLDLRACDLSSLAKAKLHAAVQTKIKFQLWY